MSGHDISRREFTGTFLRTAVCVSLLETLFSGCGSGKQTSIPATSKIVAAKGSEILNHWAIELNAICGDLKIEKITQLAWQDQIERLFDRIELNELLKFIDFENLAKSFEYPDLGVNTKPVVFPKLDGLDVRTVFVKKIFGMRKGRAIIPHGHSNMASAHLILDGKLRLRHYDRIKDQGSHLIVKPSIDKTIVAGDHSSISDERDNIHWFIAETDSAFSLDVIMLDLDGAKYDIQNLDMDKSEPIGDGAFRVQKIDVETGLKKYGKFSI
ncbi:MAG: hypothetical protein R2681_10835 [Pyrinomonadaceae bacterium]